MKNKEEIETHGKPLSYWKANAEEDYMHVPISVLKYITILEEVTQCQQDNAERKYTRDEIFHFLAIWKDDTTTSSDGELLDNFLTLLNKTNENC